MTSEHDLILVGWALWSLKPDRTQIERFTIWLKIRPDPVIVITAPTGSPQS